ncbi:MAG: DUF3096 domain-containing protein [Candidatus Aenigmarchaeota archaeon]|nr:DUF3096 domain-containing protein [Candidatus Aenigmarchaeota archaeon]
MATKIAGQHAALLSIVFGILVIVFPNLLSWLVGLFLILWGILELTGK